MKIKLRQLLSFSFTLALAGMPALADTVEYYVGIDGAPALTSGTYTGLANPNLGRLTLLFNHGDHFHGIGAYSFSGPASAPMTTPTNTNNRIPEVSSAEAPLPLEPGTGIYAGRLVNQAGASEYSDIQIASIDTLSAMATPGSPEATLFNSSSGRWTSSLAGTQIGLQLVNATPGLTVGNETSSNLFASGSISALGDGASLAFAPVFSTASTSLSGTYFATLRFVDLASSRPASGDFNFDFAVPQAVPEPRTTGMMLVGVPLVLTGLWRRQRARSSRCRLA